MELLAPAGNMEALKAAVLSGADAVYFAGKNFGARSFADNFSDEEIREAAKYCCLRSVKTYVTVNTMLLDREFKKLDGFVRLLADAGVDGVIVQDLGVMKRIAEICPDMPIHSSTQMTVHNLDGVLALERLGAKRVVLARELSGDEIKFIAENCRAELEVFVHGAMCMSYSGQCLMSSVLGGRSGNRGRCAQPCRLGYSGGGKERFYLSLKDMSLANHLKELDDMKIASLKIEGRMKGPDYVSRIVSVYRSCIDQNRPPSREEFEQLDRVFYRGGLTDGYFVNKKGQNMFAFDKPDNPYAKGDGGAAEITVEDKKIKAVCRAVLAEGEPIEVLAEALGIKARYVGAERLESAVKNPISADEAKKQLSKTGGTVFEFEKIETEIKGSPFVSVKMLNESRREVLAELEREILKCGSKKTISLPPQKTTERKEKSPMKFTASVQNTEQFEAIKGYPFAWIDLPLAEAYKNIDRLSAERDRIVISPEVIVKDGDMKETKKRLRILYEAGFNKLRAENICWLNCGMDFELIGGHRLNIANTLAAEAFCTAGLKTVCLSAELNLAQIRDICKAVSAEVILYGHMPLMLTENCVLKNIGRCPCGGSGEIYDRLRKRFPVIRDGEHCRNVILNGVPLYMGDKRNDIENAGIDFGRLLFTVEDPKRCADVCKYYFERAEFDSEYTRLHFYKGLQG